MKRLNFMLLYAMLSVSHALGQQAFSTVSLHKEHNRNVISFTVPRETNVRHYRIEGGNDSASLEIIGILASRGNAVLPVSYQYEVFELSGKYYRITMVGMDSRMQDSPLIRLPAEMPVQEPPVIKLQPAANGEPVVLNQQ